VSDLSLGSLQAVTWLPDRNKAVAVGAISYYVDHFVTGRISKFTYGVLCNIHYDSSNPEHAQRLHKSFINAMGERWIPGCFSTMLTRVRRTRSLFGVSN